MKNSEIISQAEQYILHTYNRYQIVLVKGEGVYLYDVEGKKYLDFAAGIAVFALGYQDKEYNDALKGQIDKLIHTSNLYYNLPAAKAAEKVVKAAAADTSRTGKTGTDPAGWAIHGHIQK